MRGNGGKSSPSEHLFAKTPLGHTINNSKKAPNDNTATHSNGDISRRTITKASAAIRTLKLFNRREIELRNLNDSVEMLLF